MNRKHTKKEVFASIARRISQVGLLPPTESF